MTFWCFNNVPRGYLAHGYSKKLNVMDRLEIDLNLDPDLKRQVQRLHQINLWMRWLFVIGCWLILGSFGIWGLREDIALWRDYFTWTAVRYALMFNRVPALCLAFCLGVTITTLLRQSDYTFRGLSALSTEEKQQLERTVRKIRAIGPRHPLWKWLHS
jgi:hypothetical protein